MATSGSQTASEEPVGQGDYVVQQGECLLSIADAHGLLWETIWNHPQNSALKRARLDPNVLMPGDRLFIPERTPKEESCATEKRHRFLLKGTPAKLKLRLLRNDQPRANLPYRLEAGGRWKSGTIDADGFLEETIPPGATSVHLILSQGSTQEEYDFTLGTVDPLTTRDGVLGRLANLGYVTEGDGSEAIRAFLEKKGLAVTGTVDSATQSAIKAEFGQ